MAKIPTPLSDSRIKNAKPRDKEYNLADGQKLSLRVKTNGSKIWVFNYQRPYTKKRTCLGFGNMSMGIEAYGSCTPAGIMRLIKHYDLDIQGLNAVVVGRSPILGKPMAMMLLNLNATVTICHSRTRNIETIIKQADLVVGAVGIPRFIKTEWIKKDAIVIDAGFHPEKCGDIDLEKMDEISSAYTPVPGGVGPMTINTLILHTMESAKKLLTN